MSAIITAVLISFTLLPEAAIAAEWLKVATVEDHTIYLETESVSRDDDLVRAWFLWDYTSQKWLRKSEQRYKWKLWV